MDKWDTMVGGAAQYAAMNTSKYQTLDFLSEDAKKSILWASATAIIDSYGDDPKMPHPDYLNNFVLPVQYMLRNEHGLASILSQNWVIGFSAEFIGYFVEGMWNRVRRDNEWFDESKAREARMAEVAEYNRLAKIEAARKILEDADV
jgi:hypothetical protein